MPSPPQVIKQLLEDFPSPTHTLSDGGHVPGEGADFLIGEVTDTITRVKTETGHLQYLGALLALAGSPHLKSLSIMTKLRLQSELYSLTSPGGYCLQHVWSLMCLLLPVCIGACWCSCIVSFLCVSVFRVLGQAIGFIACSTLKFT